MKKPTTISKESVSEYREFVQLRLRKRVLEAIEVVLEEEVDQALGCRSYERAEDRRGYRNGAETRRVTTSVGTRELRVRAEMHRTYASSTVPVYLDATAKELLTEGRDTFERWGLSQSRLVERESSVLLFPWCGDRVLHTLALQLNALKLSVWVEGIAIGVRDTAPKRVAEALDQVAHGAVASGSTLAALASNQIEEKYDWALTPELRSVDYASRHFDEPGARDAAREILLWDRRTEPNSQQTRGRT